MSVLVLSVFLCLTSSKSDHRIQVSLFWIRNQDGHCAKSSVVIV